MKKALGLVGATLLFAGPALGADLGTKGPLKAPPPLAPVFSWTGFYVGGHGGYGWSDSQGTSMSGGFGGGQVGYNYQMNNFVWGIEGDIAGADISQTETFGRVSATVKFDTLASLRGRFGIAYGNALFYGTAGGGWGNFKASASMDGFSASASTWLSGWTAGAGVEYAFMPNWSGKVEYLHYGFGSETFGFLGVPITSGDFGVDTIKAGINYRF
jgi:outer membrane immunogenic protein